MANGYYPTFLAACLAGSQALNLAGGALKLLLVDSGYVYSSAHDFLNDVGAGTRVATYTLENVVSSAGQLTADDDAAAFPGLTGDDVEEALLYVDTGSESTSRLVARWESVSGLPLTPDGDDIGVVWPDGFVLRLGTVTS